MPRRDARIVTFEAFDLDLETAELRRDGVVVDLPPLPSRLLVELVGAAPSLVDRETLRERLWGDNWLEWETGLHQAVRRIRAALGDSAATPRFVETVPRRGYRFIATVRREGRRRSSVPGLANRAARWVGASIGAALAAILVVAAVGSSTEGPPSDAAATPNAEAERLYREASFLLRQRRPGPAIRRLESAAAMAPAWAEPWSALAEAHLSIPASDRVEKARYALEAALARDGGSVRAWRQLARLRLWEEWDWVGARRAIEQALALEPGSAETWQMLASLETVLGDGDAAVEAARRAVYLDPVSTGLQVDLGWTLYYSGRIEAAIEECERSLVLDLHNPSARRCLIQAHLAGGNRAAAGDHLSAELSLAGVEGLGDYFSRQLESLDDGPGCGSSAASALPRMALGDAEGAMRSLLEGAREGHGWEVPFARVDPLFSRLRDRSEFGEMTRLLGLG